MDCGNIGMNKHNMRITKTVTNLFNALGCEPNALGCEPLKGGNEEDK